MPQVSFVVPVRDRAPLLVKSLDAIRRAAAGVDHEIVVVDDGSRDGSRAAAHAAGAHVVRGDGLPLGALRNRGAAAAHGEVLAFVDADVELGAGWTAVALDLLTDTGAAAAGAPYRAPADGNWVQRTYDLVRYRAPDRRSVRWVPSGAMAVRADAFRAVGGFDPELSSCEDVDLCRRLRAAGERIATDPALDSTHHGDPPTLLALWSGEVRRGAANLRVSVRRHARGELPSLLVSITMGVLLLAAPLAGVAAVQGTVRPLLLIGTAIAALLLLRAIRMARAGGWRRLPAALVIAAVYELGRAAALLVGDARPPAAAYVSGRPRRVRR